MSRDSTPDAGRRVDLVVPLVVVVGAAVVVVGARVVAVVGATVVVVAAALVSGSCAAGGAAAVRVPPPPVVDIRSTTVNTARNATKTNAARAVGPGFTGTLLGASARVWAEPTPGT